MQYRFCCIEPEHSIHAILWLYLLASMVDILGRDPTAVVLSLLLLAQEQIQFAINVFKGPFRPVSIKFLYVPTSLKVISYTYTT